jgi:hypothetical protein
MHNFDRNASCSWQLHRLIKRNAEASFYQLLVLSFSLIDKFLAVFAKTYPEHLEIVCASQHQLK